MTALGIPTANTWHSGLVFRTWWHVSCIRWCSAVMRNVCLLCMSLPGVIALIWQRLDFYTRSSWMNRGNSGNSMKLQAWISTHHGQDMSIVSLCLDEECEFVHMMCTVCIHKSCT